MPATNHLSAGTCDAVGSYPLDLRGPLCPMLRDAELLRAVYSAGHPRRELKHFLKTNRQQFQLGTVIGPEVLVGAVVRMYVRPFLRAQLRADGEGACLHHSLWACGKECFVHKDGTRAHYLAPQ